MFVSLLKARSPFPTPHGGQGLSVMALVFLAMTTTVFAGMVLCLFNQSPGVQFTLDWAGLQKWQLWRLLTYPFSTFAPVPIEDGGISASLLASFLLYCACSGGLMTSGGLVERRMGARFLMKFVIITVIVQALASMFVFGFNAAFSPVALTLGLLTLSLMVEFERPEDGREAMIDARLIAMAFILLPTLVASAFEPAFRPALTGLAVGPVLAVCAFAAKRKGERVHQRPTFELISVETQERVLSIEDSFELMPLEMLRERADDLLEKVNQQGIESLNDEQRALLTYVSQRLRSTREGDGDSERG